MMPARLLRMGFSEIAGRSVQELRKRLDRRGLVRERDAIRGVLGALAPRPELEDVHARVRAGDLSGAAAVLFERFLEAGPARFFEGAADRDVAAALCRRFPEAKAALVGEAESVLAGRFDLLGYRGLSFGNPLDWHLDPVSGRRAPLVHWSEIDVLDAARLGDSKVIWELNRHQWLVRLGQAYRITGDERYAERFAATILGWRRANPRGLGINWASSLEVALRIISWSWAMMLFRGARALGPELFVEIIESVDDHARHVERYLSHYYSPNTHLTGEALGLLYAGLVFPELSGARRWQRLGRQILVDELDRQVLPDGLHFERATCYQRYTIDTYLHVLLLSTRNGAALPREIGERVERMVDALLALRRPDGSMPSIGDADGGWLLPLASRRPDDLRGLFAVAAAVFRRADFAWAASGLAPEALWLCGPAALSATDGMAPHPPGTAGSALFPEAGYIVMRSGWDRRSHQLVFDAGPLGCPISGGHGHADLLGIQCAAFGEPIIVDPGTYCYTAEPSWRDFFRGTAAHSTVRVDGLDQAVPRGPFSWQSRPSARLRRYITTETLDVADAEHDAYARLADPVIHRRRVFWIKPRYWVIVDDLTGTAAHTIELRFQLAPVDVTVDSTLWARARTAAGSSLFIRPFATISLTAEIITGSTAPMEGWVSSDYGQRQPAPVLIYGATTRLPIKIATILLPATTDTVSPPKVTAIKDDKEQLIALTLDEKETVFLTDGQEAVHGNDREAARVDEPETPTTKTRS